MPLIAAKVQGYNSGEYPAHNNFSVLQEGLQALAY